MANEIVVHDEFRQFGSDPLREAIHAAEDAQFALECIEELANVITTLRNRIITLEKKVESLSDGYSTAT